MSKLKKFLAPVLAVSLAVILITAIGCRDKESAQSNEPGKPKIALVMKSLANEFFKTMEDGAHAHNKENAEKYDLTTVGIKNELDVAQQIKLVELMMAQGANAIVIAPADSRALVPVCKRAIDAGITVVNIDNKFDAKVLADKNINVPFVGPDNRKGAKLAGEHLGKTLKKGDKVAIIEGAPNTFNGIQRKLGFEDAMKAAGMNIVASQSGYWEMAKANKVAAAVITEHADLKAILCANDSMALGAVAAAKAAGRQNDLLIIGFDNISAAQALLKEGRILCTVDQHADQLAVFGIEYALEMLTEKAAPADKETPVDLITADTIK